MLADGSFLEGAITQFTASPEQPLGVDYRLAYVAEDGTVLVLYDNQGAIVPIGTSKASASRTAFAESMA